MAFKDTQFVLSSSDVVSFTPEQRTSTELGLYVSIYNEAGYRYRNLRYPRFKNFYGYAQIMSGAFVVREVPLNFLNQEILHWREGFNDSNDGVACGVKLILSVLSGAGTTAPIIELIRQRYTSVRFRLLPGVGANCSIVWQTFESRCGNQIVNPDPRQGQPALPSNQGASPNPRPPGQGRDDTDSSPNDGEVAGDGETSPPSPGGAPVAGKWFVNLEAQNFDGLAFSVVYDLGETDPSASVSVGVVNGPGGRNVNGLQDKILTKTVNGVTSNTPASGFGLKPGKPFYG